MQKKNMISIFVCMLLIITALPRISGDILSLNNVGKEIYINYNENNYKRGSLYQLDQQQLNLTGFRVIGEVVPFGAQSFKPSLPNLTWVELNVQKSFDGGNVIVSIRSTLEGNDLTSVSIPQNELPIQGWFEFDFPDIYVIPEETYYILVHYNIGDNFGWGFSHNDDYDRGEAWLYTSSQGWYQDINYVDFCFKTYGGDNNPPVIPSNPNPTDGATDVDVDHDLSWTCSDPDGDTLTYDVYFEANDPTPDVLVSDDQTETSFDPGTLEYETIHYWQIIAEDEYGAVTDGPIWEFTTRESIPDIDCSGTLSWTGVTPGDTVSGSITVENIGDIDSLLDWEIDSFPEWGTWTFNPENGTDLLAGETSTIDVEVVAPDEPETTFTGEVKIINSENSSNFCIIDVSLATPVSQFQSTQQIPSFLQIIIERYPILRQLLGL